MRYTLTFSFFDTEEQAERFCDRQNAQTTKYIRKNKPAHYSPWSSEDGIEHKFIAWYYY